MIWILWHRRLGDLNQMQELAKALGQPFLIKKLQFHKPFYAPLANLTLNTVTSDSLRAPWPEFIICAEALTSVVARSLKRQSNNLIKLVALARPSGSVRAYDVVLTTAQYRLPPRLNVIELSLPLTPDRAQLEVSECVESRCVVLIGATAAPEQLDVGAAHQLIADLQKLQQPLDIVTSPRTPAAIADLLARAFTGSHSVHRWGGGAQNPYARLMAQAANIIVTSDSVSMVADALATGKPVQVYPLPRRLSGAQRVTEWFYQRSPENWIFTSGIIEPTTDRTLLIDRLVANGHLSWFGTPIKSSKPFNRLADLEVAVKAVQKLR